MFYIMEKWCYSVYTTYDELESISFISILIKLLVDDCCMGGLLESLLLLFIPLRKAKDDVLLLKKKIKITKMVIRIIYEDIIW